MGEISVYFIAYCMTSSLWYVNHTVLHLFHSIDVVLLYLQKAFLAFTSLSPFCSQIFTKYATSKDKEGRAANVIGFIFPFCASVANMLMLFWGYYRRGKVMHTWAIHNNFKNANKRAQLYVLLKSTLTPFWILLGILGSLGPGVVSYYLRILVCVLIIVTFILLKAICMTHIGKKSYLSIRHMGAFEQKAVFTVEKLRDVNNVSTAAVASVHQDHSVRFS